MSQSMAFLLVSLGVAIYLAYKLHYRLGLHFRGTVISCIALTFVIYLALWQLYFWFVLISIIAGVSVIATLIITHRGKKGG